MNWLGAKNCAMAANHVSSSVYVRRTHSFCIRRFGDL